MNTQHHTGFFLWGEVGKPGSYKIKTTCLKFSNMLIIDITTVGKNTNFEEFLRGKTIKLTFNCLKCCYVHIYVVIV